MEMVPLSSGCSEPGLRSIKRMLQFAGTGLEECRALKGRYLLARVYLCAQCEVRYKRGLFAEKLFL